MFEQLEMVVLRSYVRVQARTSMSEEAVAHAADHGPGSPGRGRANVDVLEFGNGGARRTALGSRCAEVQAEVNRILDGGSSDSGKGPGNLPGCRALV